MKKILNIAIAISFMACNTYKSTSDKNTSTEEVITYAETITSKDLSKHLFIYASNEFEKTLETANFVLEIQSLNEALNLIRIFPFPGLSDDVYHRLIEFYIQTNNKTKALFFLKQFLLLMKILWCLSI